MVLNKQGLAYADSIYQYQLSEVVRPKRQSELQRVRASNPNAHGLVGGTYFRQLLAVEEEYAREVAFARAEALLKAHDKCGSSFDQSAFEQTLSDVQALLANHKRSLRQFLVNESKRSGQQFPHNFEKYIQDDGDHRIDRVHDSVLSFLKMKLKETEVTSQKESEVTPAAEQEILVFISHSSKDVALVAALIDLLRKAMGLRSEQIRASSVDGYRLPGGANTPEQIRQEITTVKVVIGLLTSQSMASTYVLFELGARWGAGRFMLPLFAGIAPKDVQGPHSTINGLSCTEQGQLLQAVRNIAAQLGLQLDSTESYLANVQRVCEIALEQAQVAERSGGAPIETQPKQVLTVAVKTEGDPPSQTLKVKANRNVSITSLAFMLSDGTAIADDDVSGSGTDFEVPIRQEPLLKVMNTPRHNRNLYDGSGPMKLGVTGMSQDGEFSFDVPARIESVLISNTYYCKLTGAFRFRA